MIDPRRTATAEIADLHLAIAPGTDVLLFNGLLAHLAAAGRLDQSYIANFTRGLGEALAAASGLMLSEIAEGTELPVSDIATFYELFAATPRVVTVYSQGVNQSTAGTDKVNAILNCHLATGRIGTPGSGPFSVTGQPNAMGGREVGGLSNMLAAHMELGGSASPQARTAVLAVAAHRGTARLQGGRIVRSGARRQSQSAVDHGDQSCRQPAGSRPRA